MEDFYYLFHNAEITIDFGSINLECYFEWKQHWPLFDTTGTTAISLTLLGDL